MIQMAVILGSVFLLTFFILVLIHTLQHLPPHITIKLHASHPTPRLTSTPRFKHRTPRSTSNATLPPHNIHQARYNATPSKQTALATHDTVWTRRPRRDAWCKNGAVSRQKPLPRMQSRSSGESASTAVGTPTCQVDEQRACPLSRLAESAEARPEGA